jgi:hypothetical protein
MVYLSRSILLLICLTVLFGCNSTQMQERQPQETKSEKTVSTRKLFAIKVNKKVGFIDSNGIVVIDPQFQGARDFVEGRAVVAVSGDKYKQGYIDETGKFAVTPQFDAAQDFSEGLAAIGIGFFGIHGEGDHKWGFINANGEIVITPQFQEARSFSEGLAAVMNAERKWGYIGKSGKLLIPFQFEDAFSFSEGLACVLTGGLFGFIDKSGKIIIEPRFVVPASFKEGLAAVELPVKDFKPYKYYETYVSSFGELLSIDKTGNTAIKFDKKVKKINEFSEGLASIEIERKEKDFFTRLIDKQGKVVFDLPFYSSHVSFSEGLARIERKNRYGFIDKTGKIVIKPVYRWAEGFQNGLAQISTSKQIWDFKGTEFFGFESNLGYIDKTGKIIWQPTN